MRATSAPLDTREPLVLDGCDTVQGPRRHRWLALAAAFVIALASFQFWLLSGRADAACDFFNGQTGGANPVQWTTASQTITATSTCNDLNIDLVGRAGIWTGFIYDSGNWYNWGSINRDLQVGPSYYNTEQGIVFRNATNGYKSGISYYGPQWDYVNYYQ